MSDHLENHQMFHSEFQMDYLITGKSSAGTLYGAYKQALRELKKRTVAIDTDSTERDLIRAGISELRVIRWLCIVWPWLFWKLTIKLRQKRVALREIERSLKDTQREYDRFLYQCDILKEKVGNLDPESRKRLDSEFWYRRAAEMMSLDIVAGGGLSKSTHEFIASLPKMWVTLLMDEIPNRESAISYIMSRKQVLPDDSIRPAGPEQSDDVPHGTTHQERVREGMSDTVDRRISVSVAGYC